MRAWPPASLRTNVDALSPRHLESGEAATVVRSWAIHGKPKKQRRLLLHGVTGLPTNVMTTTCSKGANVATRRAADSLNDKRQRTVVP